MNRLFGPEGLFYQILNRIGDLILLNALFLLTSIPVFTIGPSLCALYSVTLKMCRNEESYLALSYFSAFRNNFRKSLLLWLLDMAAFAVIAADIRLRPVLPAALRHNALYVYASLLLLLVMLAVYLFPQIAYFDNTIRHYLVNAFYLSVRYLYCTVPLVLLALLPAIAVYTGGAMLHVLLPFYLIMGFSLTALIDAYPLRWIFERFAQQTGGMS